MAPVRRGRRKRRGGGGGGEAVEPPAAAEETHQDSCRLSHSTTNPKTSQDHQECVAASPASPRYPTRRSRAFLAECATLRHPVRSVYIPSS
ncbi:UNVERIFIED_CONTAM: hypothetical protein Sangu_0505800 [Sesamum angustifolium]|uniref:Uncharacterized protein n=1 Tax=Sesamum angustifolium TaxID=2727405 RepID=A0AAW2Q8E0_9LAMI